MSRSRRTLMLASLLAALPAAGTAQRVPAGPHGALRAAVDCADCHTADAWTPARRPIGFDHEDATGFALRGRHAAASCAGCHLDLRFDAPRVADSDCAACHVDVHLGRLTINCASCHNTTSFRDAARLDQHARTSFALSGGHLRIPCESCHVDDTGGAFGPLPTDCFACHRAEYESARSVDHVAGQLPTTCTQCHATTSWHGALFDHAATAGFLLTGRHERAPCAACHIPPDNTLRWMPASESDCLSCHRADYDEEHENGFPTTCADCHGTSSWENAEFDHASSGFPLEGRHRSAECSGCHVPADNRQRFPSSGPQDCVACHRADFDDEHGGEGVPTTCVDCHTVDGWEREDFDHAAVARGFALLGGHRQAPCTSCHIQPGNTLRFHPAGQDDCIACHRPQFDAEHAGTGYPDTCLTCHTVNDWEHAAFDHASASGGYLLTGRHQTAACTSCHVQPGNAVRFQAAGPDDCIACHQANYDAQHAGSGFAPTCLDCHTVDSFEGATFDHATAANGFALVGSHAAAACSSCHIQPGNAVRWQASGQNDCIACHQADYDAQHAGSGFATTCLSCHDVNSFTGATFDHDPLFPIYSGKHQGKWSSCQQCHAVAGDYGQFTCLTCHEHRQSEMDDKHKDEAAYAYSSPLCLACHPRGDD